MVEIVRGTASGYPVRYCRNGSCTPEFLASSPPQGHNVLTDTGLELSEFDRVFRFAKADIAGFDPPRRGDTLHDSHGQCWTIRPGDTSTEAWRWHGTDQTSYQVIARRDS